MAWAAKRSGLARWLEKRGWRTEVFQPPDELPSFDKSVVMPALEVRKPSARKGIVIGWDILALAAMEFWMPESIESIVITGLNEGITQSDYTVYFPNIGKHAWD